METQSKKVTDMSMAELVVCYNELTGKSIKKFDSKAKGVARIFAFIEKEQPGDTDSPEKPVKKSVKKKAAPKKESTRKNAAADTGRQAEVVKLLRKSEYRIMDLQAHFNTTYKNITGSLFYIRKGRGATFSEGEELVCRREGMTRFYSIQVAEK